MAKTTLISFKCQIEEFVSNSIESLMVTRYSMNWRPVRGFLKVVAWDGKEEVNAKNIPKI